jgi:hypothetical protein
LELVDIIVQLGSLHKSRFQGLVRHNIVRNGVEIGASGGIWSGVGGVTEIRWYECHTPNVVLRVVFFSRGTGKNKLLPFFPLDKSHRMCYTIAKYLASQST